jgi:hypothetical protein
LDDGIGNILYRYTHDYGLAPSACKSTTFARQGSHRVRGGIGCPGRLVCDGLSPDCPLHFNLCRMSITACAAKASDGARVSKLHEPQSRANERGRSTAVVLVISLVFALTGCHPASKPNVEAKISFTQVPESNPGDENERDILEGTVRGARPSQRIVVYSKTGSLWWLQPLLTSPFTPILPDGVWRNEAHLGTDYAALLVDSSYHPAAVLDELPKRGAGVQAVAASRGQEKSSSFFVKFSGFTWRVRWRPSDRGGITNPYDPNNVYVDKDGALHLQIVKRDERWTCSEVNLTRSLGYGTYSFTVEDVSALEPAVVFGMFTWDFSTDQENHREFDINIGRWGDPGNKNAEFAVQPPFVPVNLSRFAAPAGKLKHTMFWEPGRITMVTSRASGAPAASVVSKHVFTSEVPTPGSESVRMTLFVYHDPNAKFSGLNHRAEVVVDHFEFLP